VSAFKRNLVPLLCIAFVAASAATGIFYGLIGGKLRSISASAPSQRIVVAARNLERGTVLRAEDLKLANWGGEPLQGVYAAAGQVAGKTVYQTVQQNEPVTRARVASQDGSAGIGPPSGMRAISVHATDSAGVLNLLRAGDKVDVQAVRSGQGGAFRLRTILQDVEVLAAPAAEPNGRPSATTVVTLLVTPADADRLGLADAACRIRLLLRNPLDRNEPAGGGVTLAGLFAEGRGGIKEPLGLVVQVAAVETKALEALAGKSSSLPRDEVLQVIPFDAGSEPAQLVQTLEQNHQLEVLSTTRLTASHHPASMKEGELWGSKSGAAAMNAWGLRIQVLPLADSRGAVRVRVRPEINVSGPNGLAARKMEAELALVDGQSFIVLGLGRRFFRSRLKETDNRELIALVRVDVPKPVHMAASDRGR